MPVSLLPYLTLLSVLCLAACSGSHGSSDQDPNDRPVAPRLVRFENCGDLSAYLADVSAQEEELEELYQAWAVSTPVAEGDSDVSAGGDEREYTGTNVQEEGVDEVDFVKTDGEYLYLLTGGHFLIFDAWPASETAELARVPATGDPIGLFVFGDVAAVLTRLWSHQVSEGLAPRGSGRVDLRLFDLTDRAAPIQIRELELEGTYSGARLVDGRLHLVLHTRLDPALPHTGDGTEDLEAWLPGYSDAVFEETGTTVEEGSLCACDDFYRPSIPNGTGVLTLATLDLANPEEPLHSVALASNDGIVYGSESSLYLATRNGDAWFWLPLEADVAGEPAATTVIHRFALGPEPSYEASGEVDGWILNSYSMGEHEGVLRVATSDESWWREDTPRNTVHTLVQDGETLELLGTLDGLGKPGERIYAVRFLGNRGYVVTFRQVDPLYALDLSDPTQPVIAGELEVPGFSTYLHPVADTHLLAVGQHTEPWGVDLSLFEVADPADPRLVDRVFLGEGSHSEAQYEPKAFTYFDAVGLLAIPAVNWNALPNEDGFEDESVFAGAYVYDVDLDLGFTRRGSVSHTRFYRDRTEGVWYVPEPVRRSFFIRDAGESPFLYTVSHRGLVVHSLDDLDGSRTEHPFPAEERIWLEATAIE